MGQEVGIAGLLGDRTVLDAPPLFILSMAGREELSALAMECGWKPVAARARSSAENRFLASLSRTALVDVRGMTEDEALDYVRSLTDAVDASNSTMIVTIDAALEAVLLRLVGAGATHFLVGEFTRSQFEAVLVAADRIAQKLLDNLAEQRNRDTLGRGGAMLWRWRRSDRDLAISPPLVRLMGTLAPDFNPYRQGPSALVRMLGRSERRDAVTAIRDLVQGLKPAVFIHSVPGEPGRRLIQHLYPDQAGFSGEVEDFNARRGDGRDRDAMTGLVARRSALSWIGDAIAAGERVTLLMVGISGLNHVNIAFGRHVGDAMINRVASRLTTMMMSVGGRNPLVARIAGAEFLIGIRGDSQMSDKALIDRAGFIAPQILGDIDRPFNTGEHVVRVTARGGIAVSNADDTPEGVLLRTSSALADARRGGAQGGVRVRVAGGESTALHHERIDSDLRLALERDEITILFQPQYTVVGDQMVGVEALVRWRHPVHGEIGAGALFAIAERSDFVVPLSDHIHARALGEVARWPLSLAHLRISLNVTAADMAQPDFVEAVLAQVDRSGIDRRRVTLEITESGLIEQLNEVSHMLTRLRFGGLSVAIDDFGTGYSNLTYLRSLPLDYLKLDGSLVRDVAASPRGRVILRAIIEMARSLDIKVVAEGVETEQQRMLLEGKGCEYFQGFLRSPPISSAALAALVESEAG
ncbi:MAG: GGDEF domain-containing phosphodiesterase [Sphingobium sp.]